MKKCMIFLFLVSLLSLPASAAVTHRYDFVVDANDVVGGLESVLQGDAHVANGALVCDGTDDWLDLDAAGIAINTYTTGLTLELWSTQPTDNQGFSMTAAFGDTWANGYGQDYINIATTRGNDVSRAAIANTPDSTEPWNDEVGVDGPELNDGLKHHYVLTIDDPAADGSGTLAYYIDGELQGTVALDGNLISELSNTFAYLGKGVYSVDGEVICDIDEFRIHDRALIEPEVQFSNFFGPDDAYPILIHSASPEYGKELVPTAPTLSWVPEPDITVDSYTLYLGTDPNIADPNIPDVSGISDFVVPLTSPTYTVDPANRLKFYEDYYWRVDTEVGETVYQGVGMMFTTVPRVPAFTDHPDLLYVFEGETAEYTAVCESISEITSVKWFKVGSPDVEITEADPDVTIGTVIEAVAEGYTATSTLSIANTDSADLGSYYAQASNDAGPANSNTADLVFKIQLAYYPFEDSLVDATGSGYDGTAKDAATEAVITPTFVDGEEGRAIDLDGSVAYIDLVDGLADDLRGGLTLNVWAYPRSTANWARFLSFNNGSDNDNIFFSREGTSQTLHFNVYRGSTSTGPVTAADAILLDTWQMFTVTVDQTGAAVLYKDGSPIASGTVQIPNVVARTNNWIGRSAWPDALFNGLLDEIRIYNYALAPTDVAELYTMVREDEYVCVEDPENPLTSDINGDCRVNLQDVADLVSWWLECERYPADACIW